MLRSSTRRPERNAVVAGIGRRVLQSVAGSLAACWVSSPSPVTDPSAHEAYNAWHQLDHLPEQFTSDGITFGRRWLRSPWCRWGRGCEGPQLEPFDYMTLYLMRDEGRAAPFFALAERLRDEDRSSAPARAAVGALPRGRAAGPNPVSRSPPRPSPSARREGSTWWWAHVERRGVGAPRRGGRRVAVRRRRAGPDHHGGVRRRRPVAGLRWARGRPGGDPRMGGPPGTG